MMNSAAQSIRYTYEYVISCIYVYRVHASCIHRCKRAMNCCVLIKMNQNQNSGREETHEKRRKNSRKEIAMFVVVGEKSKRRRLSHFEIFLRSLTSTCFSFPTLLLQPIYANNNNNRRCSRIVPLHDIDRVLNRLHLIIYEKKQTFDAATLWTTSKSTGWGRVEIANKAFHVFLAKPTNA